MPAQSSGPATAPTPVFGRWRLNYVTFRDDGTREHTQRVVRILEVMPTKRQIRCWCELRQAERTFSLFFLEPPIDMETGEVIDVEAWLTAYRSLRRRKKR